jgi:hypothetical protein
MARFPHPRTKSMTNLLGVTVVVVVLAGFGGVGYAWSQGGVGGGCGASLGDGYGGGCPTVGLIWQNPSGVAPSPSSVGCTLGGIGSSTLTVAVTRLAPGQSCGFHAALENVGENAVSLTEVVSIHQPSACPLFEYSDNVPTWPPAVIAPGHAFAFEGTISLSEAATNVCEGTEATVEVTITGTQSAPALTAPKISVSPTTIYSGKSSTLFTITSFSGGMSPYTCEWLVEAPGAVSYIALGVPFSCIPGDKPSASTGSLSTTGTWTFELEVTDHTGGMATSNAVTVVVLPKPVTTYSVTFSESGLPCGLTWEVTLNGVSMSLRADGGTDSLTWTGLASGSYAYSIAGISGWHQSTLPSSGSVVVSGASVTEPTLRYTQETYTVTFIETGLPPSTLWSVTLNGVTESSTSSTITFTEPNGTYRYTIGTEAGCGRSPTSGTVTVIGSGVSVSVKFEKT